MKQIVFLFILAAAAGCTHRQAGKSLSESADETAAQKAPAAEQTRRAECVPVSHKWKERNLDVFIGPKPTTAEIEEWKTTFERVNPEDSVWVTLFNYFHGESHYMAAHDLIELFFSYKSKDISWDDRWIQWRLLQFDPEPDRMPADVFGKVRYFRTLYEELLDYVRGTQLEMNIGAYFDADMRRFYLNLLDSVSFDCADGNVRPALKKEAAARDRYNAAAYGLYTKIDGSPREFNGSSYPYRIGMFEVLVLDGEISASERVLNGLTNDVIPKNRHESAISGKHIEKEYATFAASLEENDYGYPLKERLAALEQDRKAWNRWMACRNEVSRQLTGNARTAYDMATQALQRYKLIMLKNRYEKDDAFCPTIIEKHLLSYETSTDADIFAHNLELLLEAERKQ